MQFFVIVVTFALVIGPITSGLIGKKSFFSHLFKGLIFGHKTCYSSCKCGIPNREKAVPKGNHMQPNEFPWLAIIYDPNDIAATFSGTLINDRYVITAAKNVYGKAPFLFKVKLGYHFHCHYEATSVTYSVSALIVHPNYYHNNEEHHGSDVALLRMSSLVYFNREISPICLPTPGLTYNGQVGTVASWNFLPQTTFSNQIISCSPRKYGLPISVGVDCGQPTNLANEGCIGVFGSNSVLCHRDSGTGVYYRSFSGYYELVGVLSDRQNCGDFLDNLMIKDDPMKMNLVSNKTEIRQGDIQFGNADGVDRLEMLPIFGILNHHLDWIFENTKDSCFCKKP